MCLFGMPRDVVPDEFDRHFDFPVTLYAFRSVSFKSSSSVLSANGRHRQRSDIKLTWEELIPVVYEKWDAKTRYVVVHVR